MIRFSCPKCRKSCKAPASSAGRKVRCARCNTRFKVPVDYQAGEPAIRQPTSIPVPNPAPQHPPLGVVDSALLFGSVKGQPPDDSSSEEVLLASSELESPERQSTIGPLMGSLSIVMGLLLIVLLIVVLRHKAAEQAQERPKGGSVAKLDKPAVTPTVLQTEPEKEPRTKDPDAERVPDVSGEIRKLQDKLAERNKKSEPRPLPEEVEEEPPKTPESNETEP